ncbi:MAG TPA: hypothetical protein VFR67_30445, partial [Pilimelia sp.]|nr:hypothetical protein [Pilimelia sp.]
MPAHVTRRQLLATSAAAAGTAAIAGVTAAGSQPAAAASGAVAVAAVHEEIVRDARMLWRRLPESWQTGPFLGNGFLAVHVYGA